jgi:hypothetical protein
MPACCPCTNLPPSHSYSLSAVLFYAIEGAADSERASSLERMLNALANAATRLRPQGMATWLEQGDTEGEGPPLGPSNLSCCRGGM